MSPISSRAGRILLAQTRVADRLIFVTGGVSASEQSWRDGRSTIARFFEPTDFCTNVSSAWTGDIASDDLIAITDVEGLSIPLSVFMQDYLTGGTFGIYLRHRMLEAHLFAKELACAKTSIQIGVRYSFLQTHHRTVLETVPQKDIARFLGVTPEGLSRFLRNRRASA